MTSTRDRLGGDVSFRSIACEEISIGTSLMLDISPQFIVSSGKDVNTPSEPYNICTEKPVTIIKHSMTTPTYCTIESVPEKAKSGLTFKTLEMVNARKDGMPALFALTGRFLWLDGTIATRIDLRVMVRDSKAYLFVQRASDLWMVVRCSADLMSLTKDPITVGWQLPKMLEYVIGAADENANRSPACFEATTANSFVVRFPKNQWYFNVKVNTTLVIDSVVAVKVMKQGTLVPEDQLVENPNMGILLDATFRIYVIAAHFVPMEDFPTIKAQFDSPTSDYTRTMFSPDTRISLVVHPGISMKAESTATFPSPGINNTFRYNVPKDGIIYFSLGSNIKDEEFRICQGSRFGIQQLTS